RSVGSRSEPTAASRVKGGHARMVRAVRPSPGEQCSPTSPAQWERCTSGMWRIGIDIGGTFTDVAMVEADTGRIEIAKVPTTPRDFGRGVIDGISRGLRNNAIDPATVTLLSHATTVVTN